MFTQRNVVQKISVRENILVGKIFVSLALASLTGLLAGIRIPLPFTPVPLTGQVLGVLLCGLFQEGSFAALSQTFYLLFGLGGIPWFAGWSSLSLLAFFANPTSGYLVGFIPAAYLVGRLANQGKRLNFPGLLLTFFAGIVIIYLFGALHLSLVLKTDFRKTLFLAVYPFILFDFLKALLVASFANVFCRR